MKHKQIILNALNNYLGDDYYRARAAFGHLSTSELNKEYGNSGETKAQILDQYKRFHDSVTETINWVKQQ